MKIFLQATSLAISDLCSGTGQRLNRHEEFTAWNKDRPVGNRIKRAIEMLKEGQRTRQDICQYRNRKVDKKEWVNCGRRKRF